MANDLLYFCIFAVCLNLFRFLIVEENNKRSRVRYYLLK